MAENSEKLEDLHDNKTTNTHLFSSNKSDKCEVWNQLLIGKKKEEVQGYAEKLTKIKSKVRSRRSPDSTLKVDGSDDAKTPSEKSLLLKKKVEENRKIFELRNKELNESKRAAEVQVEKILQQLNDGSSISSDIPFVNPTDNKDTQISELNSKINELESIIVDLKDSLSNKDSVIEAKTKAITLVTDNLSKKSKVTLDKLVDTKDEMRHMQETFIAAEEGFKIKINNLLSQLQEKDSNVVEYEDKLKNITSENDQLKSQIDNYNDIISDKDKQIIELKEKLKLEEDLHNLINDKDNQITKLQSNIQELNHNMIKIKAQSKSKLKNLQGRLDSYYKSSSSNEERVNLVNKVTLLEEEIGNLQLVLVDFDEMKVVNNNLKKRITELEDELAQNTEKVQLYNYKIVALENQKFELNQELHEVKQELSALDSLKCVEFEEKQELYNQNHCKDTANNTTQNNLELIEILNQLKNQVILIFNEEKALGEKLNNITMYLNNDNETLTNLKSEINSMKLIDLDNEYISHSALLINELAERLENKSKLLNESDHEKMFIDKLTGAIHSLLGNIKEKQNSLQIIMNDPSLEHLKSISNQVIQDSVLDIRRIIDEQLEIMDDKFKPLSELQNQISVLENQLMERDQLNNNNVIKINELSDEIVNLRETFVIYERNLTQALQDKELLKIQVKENEEKIASINVDNEDILVKNNKLLSEVDVLDQKFIEYEKNYAYLLNDNKMLENRLKINDEKLESINLLQEQIEKLNEELINNNKMIEAIQNEKTIVENQLQEKEHLHQESTRKINQLSDEITVLNQRLIEYDEQFMIALNDKQLLSEQIKVKDGQLASMNELNKEIEQLNIIIRNKEAHLESLVDDKSSLEDELRQKTELAQDNALRVDELTSEISQRLKESEELNTQLEQKDEKIKSLIESYATIHETLADTEQKLKARLIEIHNFEHEVNYLSQITREQQDKLVENNLHREELQNELEIKNEKVRLVEELNISISNDNKMMENEIMEKNEQLKTMNSLKDQIELLHTELTNKNDLIDSLAKQKLTTEEKLKEVESVKDKVDQLNREIADKDVVIEEMLKEKNNLMEKLNETNTIIMEEFRREIESAKAEISKRDVNITSLLDNTMHLEEELRKVKEQWSNDQEKLEIAERLNVQLKHEIDQLNKIKLEMESSQSAINESRAACVENLNEMNTELKNVVESIDSQSIEDTKRISWLEQELESAKTHNSNQIHRMRVIAANLKKKTNECEQFETTAKEFQEKWESEVSEKKELVIKLRTLESNLSDKDVKIAEFNELLKKRENDLQYLNEKIEIFERDINDRVVQFNYLREKIVTELENCKKEHLVDESLKETYKKLLELGIQVKEMELRNISDWSLLELLKSEKEDLLSDTHLNELQENTGVDYSDKYNMFEFIASKIVEDVGTNRKDFKNIISKIAEKYVIIENLKFKNKKLVEIIDSINANRQVSNEQLQPSQITEPLEMKVKEESVNMVSDTAIQEETGQVEDIKEENQLLINLDDEEIWGENEENTEPTEFKIPICTPETELQIKIAELEDKVKDLQDQRIEVNEELKVIRIKNQKLIKKLEGYKIQNYNLQQQVKLQSNSSKFNDLDYTIEEELKSQITQLEANLNKLKEDNEKVSTERDNLLNKIDILTATKDELNKTMTMKNNELMMQIQHLGQSIQSNDSIGKFSSGKGTDSESGAANKDQCTEHEQKISKLEKDLNDILSENDELKGLIDTYETELNLNMKKKEKLSNQTEYSELNFCNMLEEVKPENISADHQLTLEKERLENDELKVTISNLKQVEQDLNEKISKLEKDLQEKRNEIDAMKLSFDHLESLWNSEIQNRAKMEQEYEELKNKLYATEEELKEVNLINEPKLVESDRVISSSKNDSLEEELENKNEEIITLSSNYDQLKHALDEQLQQNNELQSKYDKIVNEINLKTREFDQQYLEKEMKIENLEQNLKETLETLHNKAQELNDLEHKLRDFQDLNKKVPSGPISELQTIQLLDSEKLVDQEIHLPEETSEKSTKVPENYSKLYEELQRQLAEANDAMTNVTDLLNIRVQEVADLKQYIKKLEFDKMAVDNANSELSSVNLKLTDKNQELINRLDLLKTELDEKIQAILSLETKLTELQSLHNSAISDLNNHNLQIKTLKDVINNNEVLIQNLEASVVDRDLQISNVREELSDCHNKIQELSTMVFNLQNSMILPEKFNEKLHEIDRLEETIKTMEEKHNVLTDEYEKKLSENTIALDELKSNLNVKNEEVEDLKFILNENTYPGMIQELQDKIDQLYEEKQKLQLSVTEKANELSSQNNKSEKNVKNVDQSQVEDSISSELDTALYMLHQRDVRCEELTHELLQLLEERDTLQLRLSNVIKMNEELKKYAPSTSEIVADDVDSGSGGEATSSSTTLAKPLKPKEDTEVLEQKLSQLHNVNYHKDVLLVDERKSRHIQQMSVILPKNTPYSSSTDSSPKIIDTNYTVSRDVQSQPNVLLNWFRGTSTRKAT